MDKGFNRVYQFHISLDVIRPAIWRRVQVPENYSFWDFHVAIQDAMGWEDCHLHQFDIANPTTGKLEYVGIPDDEFLDETRPVLADWETSISDYFVKPKIACRYEYDFGDSWSHEVKLEEILDLGSDVKYPHCIDGRRACPPEDCGGFPGYERLLEIIKDPEDGEFESMMEWLGGSYNPEKFSTKVRFSNPKTRLRNLLKAYQA